jgi:ABC-type Fe3+-hydroxamate transport system substrate-binding protein
MLTDSNELFCIATESGNAFLEYAGAINLASGLGHPFPLLSREWLVAQGPDFILIPVKEGQDAQKHIQALRQKLGAFLPPDCRFIVMEEGLTFGLRSFLGILKLASELYPSRISEKDFLERKAAFMQTFFATKECGGHPCP